MKASDNPFPSVLLDESTTPANPPTGSRRLFIDSADGLLKLVDSTGAVVLVDATDVDVTVSVLRDKLTAAGGETTLTFGELPVANSMLVWKNNTPLWPTDDWTVAAGVLTFAAALTAADVIRTYYLTTATGSAASALA